MSDENRPGVDPEPSRAPVSEEGYVLAEAEEAAEEVQEAVEEAVEAAQEAAADAADAVEPAVDAAGEAAEDAGEAAGEAAEDAGEAAGEAAEDAGDVAADAAEAAGEAAEDAAEAAGEAAQDAAEAAEDAAEAAEDAAQEAAEAAQPAVEEAGAALNDAGEAVTEAAEPVVEAAGEAAGEVAEAADETASKAGAAAASAAGTASAAVAQAAEPIPVAFQVATGSLQETLDELKANVPSVTFPTINAEDLSRIGADAWQAAALLATGVYALLQFEIIRDFYQLLSIFGIRIDFVSVTWARISGWIFSLSFLDIDLPISPTVVVIIKFALSLIMFGIFASGLKGKSAALSSGLEVTTWEHTSKAKRMLIKVSAIILMSLYLPTVQSSLLALVSGDTVAVIIGVASLIIIGVGVPWLTAVMITRELPTVDPYDEDGMPFRAGNREFATAVSASASPYRFLFEGYEEKWSRYKVFIMLYKVAVVGAMFGTAFIASQFLSRAVGLGVVALLNLAYLMLSSASQPFLSPAHDVLDLVSRVNTFLSSALGIIPLVGGIIVFILQIVNAVVMLSMVVFRSDKLTSKIKALLKRLDLTPDLYAGQDPETAVVDKKLSFADVKESLKYTFKPRFQVWNYYPMVFSPNLDLARELRSRVWRPFWDGIFTNDPMFRRDGDETLAFADTIETPAYLLGFVEGSVYQRHRENRRVLTDVGLDKYKCGLDDGLVTEVEGNALLDFFVGVDCWWEGEGMTNDDRKPQPTGKDHHPFGKMYCLPFPFTAVVYYDDGSSHSVLSTPEDLKQLVEVNQSDEVQERRRLRHMLRALARSGELVYFEHQQNVRIAKTERVSDGKGGTESRTRYVNCLCHYKNGKLRVGTAGGAKWKSEDGSRTVDISSGFDVSISYSDGTGVDDDGVRQTNQSGQANAEELGVTPRMEMNDSLSRLLDWEDNARIAQEFIEAVREDYQEYRVAKRKEFDAKAVTLPYDFQLKVYNNYMITRQELEAYLGECQNEAMRNLPTSHAKELDYLFAVQAFTSSHKLTAYWYVFWHDVWKNNGEPAGTGAMKAIKENHEIFDPTKPASLAYNPCTRPELVKRLDDMNDKDARSLFSDKVLDMLYANMARVARGQPANLDDWAAH